MSAVADVFPWEVCRCSESFATDWPVNLLYRERERVT
jgi:hypothetical protein